MEQSGAGACLSGCTAYMGEAFVMAVVPRAFRGDMPSSVEGKVAEPRVYRGGGGWDPVAAPGGLGQESAVMRRPKIPILMLPRKAGPR